MSETTSTVYVTRSGSSELVMVDEVSGFVTTVPTGAIPCAVAVNPVTNTAYVVNHGDDTVTVIDGARRVVIATVKVGLRPQAVAVDAKRNLVYVANSHSDDVTVIDGARNLVLKTLNTGKNPIALYAGVPVFFVIPVISNARHTSKTNEILLFDCWRKQMG